MTPKIILGGSRGGRLHGHAASGLPATEERNARTRTAEATVKDNGPILIVGAGIGGLTLARGLLRNGFDVRVFEREPEFRSLGAGLMVQINGMLALRHLDLDRGVRDQGVVVERGSIQRHDGTVISEMPFSQLAREYGMPTVAIHRRRLHQVLLDAVGAEYVRVGANVRAFVEDSTSVTLEIEGGTAENGAALVGADGLRSVVRRQLLGNDDLRYSGYTSWRGICQRGTVLIGNEVTEVWGRGCRFGFVPVGPEEIYWYAVDNAPAGQTDKPNELKPRLREIFSCFRDPVQSILEATPVEDILRTDVYDRKPAREWGRGRATLLGDAAHPMMPDLGQGACQAIEDAVVLVDRLCNASSIESGFRDYERVRLDRTSRIVKQALRFGRIAQWENPLACWLRDTLVRSTPDRVGLRETRKLWSFDLDDGRSGLQ